MPTLQQELDQLELAELEFQYSQSQQGPTPEQTQQLAQSQRMQASGDPYRQLADLTDRRARGEQGLDEQIAALRQQVEGDKGGMFESPLDTGMRLSRPEEDEARSLARVPTSNEDVFSSLKTGANVVTGFGGMAIAGLAGAIASPLGFLEGMEFTGADTTRAIQAFMHKFQLGADDPRVAEFGQNLQAAVKSANVPIGGIAGLTDLATGGDLSSATGLSEDIRGKGISKFLGDETLEKTGSPLFATGAELLPSLLTSGLVPKIPLPKGKPKAPPKPPTPIKAGSDEAAQQVAKALKKEKDAALVKMVDADPAFFKAADELGVTAPAPARFASKNPEFVAVESGLASVPTSVLGLESKAFIESVAKQADEMIEKLGGTLDKGQLNLDFKSTATKTIDDLAQSADDAYGALAKVLPKEKRHAAPETVGFIENVLAKELGGVAALPGKFKTMLDDLKPKTKSTVGKKIINPATGEITRSGAVSEVINPTLGKIDFVRREVGQALNKKSGQFKDAETGTLKALYSTLVKDQDAIGMAAGKTAQGLVTTAKGLVQKRKLLEDDMVSLLGKDLDKSISVGVSGALKGLAKGDIAKFKKVIGAIPKAQRPEVVMSMMNDVMRGTAVGKQALDSTQFVKWYQNINRSPAVSKELFAALPKGAKKNMDALFKVNLGISKALGEVVSTGKLKEMFNNNGFIRNVVGKSAEATTSLVTRSPTVGGAVGDFLRGGKGIEKTTALLSSDKFKTLIRDSAKDGALSGAKISPKTAKLETAITKTPVYKKWLDTLGPAQQERLARFGLVAYLFSEEEEQQ